MRNNDWQPKQMVHHHLHHLLLVVLDQLLLHHSQTMVVANNHFVLDEIGYVPSQYYATNTQISRNLISKAKSFYERDFTL